tara:strand:+ start:2167 stop:2376 length:210 start_codon:yes stop_codon:yes gene_type:complete
MALNPKQMSESIIRNLPKKTGKSLDEWIEIIVSTKLQEKSEIIEFLKTKKKLGHFQAQVVFNNFKTLNS